MSGQKRSMKKGVDWIENQGILLKKLQCRPTLDPSISETKYDRDKLIFLLKDGVNQIMLRHKIGTQSD